MRKHTDMSSWVAVSAAVILLGEHFSIGQSAAQFVELTADVQTVRWINSYKEKPPRVQIQNSRVRCVAGTNSWMIEMESGGMTQDAWWFTGSNIIAHTTLLKLPTERLDLFRRNHPEMIVGRGYTDVREALHNEPALGRALFAVDSVYDCSDVNLAWLAFCSGPYLKQDGRFLNTPSTGHEETLYDSRSDITTVFKDGLGLPTSIEFNSANQPICHYRTVGSTNVLGWNFPLEFYSAQYRRNWKTQGWELHMTASGKLVSIAAGTEPRVPTERQLEIEKSFGDSRGSAAPLKEFSKVAQ